MPAFRTKPVTVMAMHVRDVLSAIRSGDWSHLESWVTDAIGRSDIAYAGARAGSADGVFVYSSDDTTITASGEMVVPRRHATKDDWLVHDIQRGHISIVSPLLFDLLYETT